MGNSVFIPPSPDALASKQAMSMAYTLVSLLAEMPYSEWNTEVGIQCSGTDYETICIRWMQKLDIYAGMPVHGVTVERVKHLKLNSRISVKLLDRMASEIKLTDVLNCIFETLEKEKNDYLEGRKV